MIKLDRFVRWWPGSAGLLALLVSFGLSGCGLSSGREITFDAVLEGQVALDSEDGQALERLLAVAGLTSRELRLHGPEASNTAAPPFFAIDGDRVVHLALEGLGDPSAASQLRGLRSLHLEGPFSTLDLADLPHLARLRIDSRGELGELKLARLPDLEELLVHGARLRQAPDLSQLDALRVVALSDCGLRSFPRLAAAGVEDLALPSNRIVNLETLVPQADLERLQLSGNQLQTLAELPLLPRLRVLDLSDNPLAPEARLDAERLPALATLDLRRTGWRKVLPGLEKRAGLRLKLEEAVANEVAFEETLAKIRHQRASWASERVAALPKIGGTLSKSSGKCSWRVGSHHRARVSCRFSFAQLRGLASARLGETDLTLPFQGGGGPQVRVTLRVSQGQAAVYLRQEFDSIADARLVSGLDQQTAETFRQANDRFSGHRRAVASPSSPAAITGEPDLLGSRVVLWIEAIDGTAEDLELIVESL